MPTISKQAAAILAANASQIVRQLQAKQYSYRQLEARSGIDKAQLLRIGKGQTTSEESFRRLVALAIEEGII